MQSNDICDYCKAKDCWTCMVEKDHHYFSGIEVESVRHGRWQKVCWTSDISNSTVGYKCSECLYIDLVGTSKYCPNCGARMDGDE